MRRIYLQPGRAGAGGASVQDDFAEVRKEKEKKEREKRKRKVKRGGYWQPAGETLPAVVVYWLMESCGTWYGKMEWREYVGRSSRKRFYWKAELDAAGFICAEENDK